MREVWVAAIPWPMTDGLAVPVRIHAGTLKVGDVLTSVTHADGTSDAVRLECLELRLAESILLDEMEANYGGLAILRGDGIDFVQHLSTLA